VVKVRSPNYPGISLQKAIDLVRRVYEENHLHQAEPEAVVRAMGYGSLNGTSKTMLSALKKYGLLDEDEDGQLRVSKPAMSILVDPAESPERLRALTEAALAPSLFAELHQEYGSSVPNDTILRSFLLKRGFSPNTVDAPISAYRDTAAYVANMTAIAAPRAPEEAKAEVDGDLLGGEDFQLMPQPAPRRPPSLNVIEATASVPGEREWLRGPLGRETAYRILVTGEIGAREISKLVKLLEAQKLVFEDEAED